MRTHFLMYVRRTVIRVEHTAMQIISFVRFDQLEVGGFYYFASIISKKNGFIKSDQLETWRIDGDGGRKYFDWKVQRTRTDDPGADWSHGGHRPRRIPASTHGNGIDQRRPLDERRGNLCERELRGPHSRGCGRSTGRFYPDLKKSVSKIAIGSFHMKSTCFSIIIQ